MRKESSQASNAYAIFVAMPSQRWPSLSAREVMAAAAGALAADFVLLGTLVAVEIVTEEYSPNRDLARGIAVLVGGLILVPLAGGGAASLASRRAGHALSAVGGALIAQLLAGACLPLT